MSNFPANDPFSQIPSPTPPQNAANQLGNLAQSARKKQLKSAKGILIFIGILTIVGNLVMIPLGKSQIEKEIQKEIDVVRRSGMVVDQGQVAKIRAEANQVLMVACGIAAAIGVVFLVLGFCIYMAPVPITITALVLYVASNAIYGFLEPATLAKGLVMKIIVVVCLFKAIGSAIAYQNEEAAGQSPYQAY